MKKVKYNIISKLLEEDTSEHSNKAKLSIDETVKLITNKLDLTSKEFVPRKKVLIKNIII